MRTTVLIPLHRSGPWLEPLTTQLHELRGTARLVVSDATGIDSTLDDLRARVGDDPSITWLAPRPIAAGWVAHSNDLLLHAASEFVMWLPHDDRIGAEWITEAERALDDNPSAVAACGAIDVLQRDSRGRGASIEVPAFVSETDDVARLRAALTSIVIGHTADLGILYRSVVKRGLAHPLPPGLSGDDWSDVLWALQLLSHGTVAALSARYGKRWHDDDTHGAWSPHDADPAALRRRMAAALSPLSADDRDAVLATAWGDEVARARAALQAERENSARALHDLTLSFERSHSWRATAGLRALSSLLRPRSRR